MVAGRRTKSVILPPPAGTILLYAADGLAASRGDLSPTGKPRTPSRDQWVPLFRGLVGSKEGLVELQGLATAGMKAWNCPPGLMRCLNDAFQDITFPTRLIATLDDLAATAREKIPEPVPPMPATAPGPTQPRQASPQDEPQSPIDNHPQRPRSRNQMGMKPPEPN
jgi:hypothetical protein